MLIDETPPCVSLLRGRYAVLICSRQIGQGSATPQMAGQEPALREPPRKGHDGVAALDKGIGHCLRTAPCPDPSGGL